MKACNILYEYVYTICLTLEANFNDDTKYRLCIVRTFMFNGNPIKFSIAFKKFLEKEQNSITYKKGTQKAKMEIINIQIIDKNKIPYEKSESVT